MATDNERREIAAKLRKADGDLCIEAQLFGMSWCDNHQCHSGGEYENCFDAFKRKLADLIEPERTCTNVSMFPEDSFTCSECGAHYGTITGNKRCPECGAKVVS